MNDPTDPSQDPLWFMRCLALVLFVLLVLWELATGLVPPAVAAIARPPHPPGTQPPVTACAGSPVAAKTPW
jgi:hypothetical protein